MKEKIKKESNVPNLRFPGFEGEWMETTLGNCSQSLDYGMNAAAIGFDGENKYIRITDIDESTSKYISYLPVSPTGELEDKYLVKENDILFARTGASTGKTYLYHAEDGKLYFAGFLIRATVNSANNARFIFNQTKTSSYNKWVKLTSMRSGQPGINSQEYASFRFWIPSKQEQNKIASFLSLIDERLSTQSKIIEYLQTLMKGLSEKLFSQQLRFKDDNGNDFPIWEEKKLGEIYSFRVTNSFSRDNLNYETGEIKNIHYGDIHTKFKTLFNIAEEQVPYINSNISTSRIQEENYCNEGDLIFADASEDLNDIGKAMEIVNLNDEKLLSGLHTILARPISRKLCVGFGGYLFQSVKIRKQIQKESQGTKVIGISAHRLANIELQFPCLAEQAFIANFLSFINEKMEAERKILQQYERQKKYLLQNMFI